MPSRAELQEDYAVEQHQAAQAERDFDDAHAPDTTDDDFWRQVDATIDRADAAMGYR